jgi:hypothetical protein
MADFQALLATASADSAALTGFSAVAHRFDHGGDFAVQVLKGPAAAQVLAHTGPHAAIMQVAQGLIGHVGAAFSAAGGAIGGAIAGAGGGPAPVGGVPVEAAPGGQTPLHAALPIDIATLAGAMPGEAGHVGIAPGQYVLFHALTAGEPHAVVIQPGGGGGGGGAGTAGGFDSRQLGPGDVFTTVLVRPGRYDLANTLGGSPGTLTVAYPVATPGKPYSPPDPLAIDCGAGGFSPATASILPGQGLIFRIGAPARITISLAAADDGPVSSAS